MLRKLLSIALALFAALFILGLVTVGTPLLSTKIIVVILAGLLAAGAWFAWPHDRLAIPSDLYGDGPGSAARARFAEKLSRPG